MVLPKPIHRIIALIVYGSRDQANNLAGSLSGSKNVTYVPASGGNLLMQVPQ